MSATGEVGRLAIAGDAGARGRLLGAGGRDAFAQVVPRSSLWRRVTAADLGPVVRRLADATLELFPEIHDEIAAMAEEIGMPFDQVFAWNSRGDLLAGLGEGCTTVQVPGDVPVIAHNEDGLPGLRGRCFLADLRPDGAPEAMSFCYPGSIPGHSFAVTQAGLAITVNNLRLLGITPEIPRMVLMRALLSVPDRRAAVDLLRKTPPSAGYHLSIAEVGARDVWSVTFGGGVLHVAEHIRPALHSNHAQVDGPVMSHQIITASSRDRLSRGLELLEQGADPLPILTDTGGAGLPIFRTDPDDPDRENTLAQFQARITPVGIDWQVHAPGQSEPVYRGLMPVTRGSTHG